MSNVVIRVNGSVSGDGFLVAPDGTVTFPVSLNLSTNDGTTVNGTVDVTPNGAGVTVPSGTISITPAGVDIPIQATAASSTRGDTVVNVRVGGVTTSFVLTAIRNPEVWFRGRFEARFATDDDWYNDPKGTWGAGNEGTNPLGFGNEGPGWTWVLEGEPDFVPADSVATSPYKPVGRVVRFNNPVALRSHADPVVTTVDEIRGLLAGGTTEIFTAGDPVIGTTIDLGPDTYLASNDPARPSDPPPAETAVAGYEAMALFEFHLGGYISGKSASLGDRPKAAGLVTPVDADEKAAIGFVDLPTFTAQRLALLQADYNALSPADRTGTAAGRNLKRRIDHLTGAAQPTLPQGWDGKEEYTGQVNDSLAFAPGGSSVVSFLSGFASLTFFGRFFAFHSDELCGHVHGSVKANLTARVVKECLFITDRSTFGKDEIDAMLLTSSPASVQDAFYVIVDGFRPSELGITAGDLVGTPSVQPAISASPAVLDMTVGNAGGKATALVPQDPSLPASPQRFTWVFPITFASTNGFVPGGQTVMLTATIAGLSGNAQIELTEAGHVYEVDGPVSWLSADTRVFLARAGETWFNATLGTTPADASSFIKAVIANLNSGTAGQTFDSLPADESTSALALYQEDQGTPVFNFALARVRYRALVADVSNVRVFFRLCPALSVAVDYDQATTYRRAPSNADGQPIPLLGVQGGNLVTLPFFAEPRIPNTSTSNNMTTQPDPANVQPMSHDAMGAEVVAYFGCWLDINQPGQLLFPLHPTGDGPFTGPLKSILELVRNDHQCLLAEIAFDPDPISGHPSPAMSDKLAQRNLALSPSDNPGSTWSRRMPNTFELKPTDSRLSAGAIPDELMILWGNTPAGSTAQIYIPTLKAEDVVAMANSMYLSRRLTAHDEHTLLCRAEGVTYVPIPPGAEINHAGLLTVDLPDGVRRGQLFRIVVRQLTDAVLSRPVRRPGFERRFSTLAKGSSTSRIVRWRRVRGSFQISIPVGSAHALLQPEERRLSILRFIENAIPEGDRWYRVYRRFVQQVAERVSGFGGDPSRILPSPDGVGVRGHLPRGTREDERREERTGKVSALVYDRFGDFVGFHLDTEEGERHFRSEEPEVERLARRAWIERILVTVLFELDEPQRPMRIILRRHPRLDP